MADHARLAQLLGVLALAATDRFRGRLEGTLGRGGAHAAALIHLDAYPGDSIEALRAVLGISQPGTVALVNRLEADGLVSRRSGADARTRALHPTPAGRSAARRVLADRHRELDRILAPLGRQERETLEPLLETLVANLAHDRGGALTVCRL